MDKQKQIEDLTALIDSFNIRTIKQAQYVAEYIVDKLNYRKIPENAVVINKDENPCLSCPVPEDIQRDVDCSTICGSVRLGIDWQNQCKVLVKENKQLTKALAETRKETAEKFAEKLKEALELNCNHTGEQRIMGKEYIIGFEKENCFEIIDEICKEITAKIKTNGRAT